MNMNEKIWKDTNEELPHVGQEVLVITDYLALGKPCSQTFVGYLDEDGDLIEVLSDSSYGWEFKECVSYWMKIPLRPI